MSLVSFHALFRGFVLGHGHNETHGDHRENHQMWILCFLIVQPKMALWHAYEVSWPIGESMSSLGTVGSSLGTRHSSTAYA